jgi:hypothetical protein
MIATGFWWRDATVVAIGFCLGVSAWSQLPSAGMAACSDTATHADREFQLWTQAG